MKISRTMLMTAFVLSSGAAGFAQAQTDATRDATTASRAQATRTGAEPDRGASPQVYPAQTVMQGATRGPVNAGPAHALGAADGASAARSQSVPVRPMFHDAEKLNQHFLTQP